jgi:L-threonylcarbamoyladenylate synthase
MTLPGSHSELNGALSAETTSHLILQASAALRAGQIVAIPTDTVYGLAAALDRPDAISRLYALKRRPSDKAIPVLLSDPSQVHQVATGLSEMAEHLALSFWPGGLTLVLASHSHLPPHVTSSTSDGLATVAVRVPDHSLARAIIQASGGALAVTSANESGQPPALEARAAAALRASPPILVIDGGRVARGIPSTVVLATGATPVILREGVISAADIAAALGNHQNAAGGGSAKRFDQPPIRRPGPTDVADAIA